MMPALAVPLVSSCVMSLPADAHDARSCVSLMFTVAVQQVKIVMAPLVHVLKSIFSDANDA